MNDCRAEKAAARSAALTRRKKAFDNVDPSPALRRLIDELAPYRGRPVSGYMAIRTEIDPISAMLEIASDGPVCVPVIQGRGQPLKFRQWTPGCILEEGAFGAMVPASGDWIVPTVLIVPLMAFDTRGYRLGYGGGFYDRTLQELRATGEVRAIGLAYSEQQVESLPAEATDQRLDSVVTERAVLTFDR